MFSKAEQIVIDRHKARMAELKTVIDKTVERFAKPNGPKSIKLMSGDDIENSLEEKKTFLGDCILIEKPQAATPPYTCEEIEYLQREFDKLGFKTYLYTFWFNSLYILYVSLPKLEGIPKDL